LNVFDVSTGQLMWNYTFADRHSYYFNFSPAVADGSLLISNNYAVFAFTSPNATHRSVLPWEFFNALFVFVVVVAVILALLKRRHFKNP